jgi:hypothetical protein
MTIAVLIVMIACLVLHQATAMRDVRSPPMMLSCVLIFEVLPYLEELVCVLRARKPTPVKSALPDF